MPTIRFFNEGVTCEVEVGENLRQAALRAGVQLYRGWHIPLNCKGRGKCGSCRIELADSEAVVPPDRTAPERRFLDGRFSDAATRLACQVCVQRNVSVRTQPRRGKKVETRSFIPRGF